ncbi:uncharacterized protein [Amphiura filiformis]|uniref:uncharacterized protein isoform X2 n=1 Tax=Amphiura filiformis TaxID=82378 RepID=UPI003B22658E
MSKRSARERHTSESAEDRERAAKKKLQNFLTEMLRVGCVRGFKYFSMYMRGREEMICTVLNEPLTPTSASPAMGTTSEGHFNFEGSFTSSDLPFEQLSGLGYMDVGLPPASPSEREIIPMTDDRTVFLIAGYAKYSCPYVWVRNNHERLVKLKDGDSSKPSISRDSPLKLKSTSHWNDKDIRIWDVLGELVKLSSLPSPHNPFAVDLEYFTSLPVNERIVASAAMVHFLQCVLIYAGNKSYSGLVADDLREITKHHFADFQTYLLQSTSQQREQDQTASNQSYSYQQQQGMSSSAGAATQPHQAGYSTGRTKLTQRVVAPY